MRKPHDDMTCVGSEYVDPLYGIYRVDEPIASKLGHPALQNQIERLERIKSLGLIFRFFPAGNHTKWEHYLGMYCVASNVRDGLNKQDRDDLQWLCLLRGLGHLPCTHVSASAIFLAITLSGEFSKRLRNLLRPTMRLCRRCETRDLCLDQPERAIFENHQYRALRGALSAHKLTHLPTEVDMGHRESLARGLMCPADKLYRLCDAISRYDYMQRDLYHTGLATFNMGYDEAFKALHDGIEALEASPPMRLLDELYDYLVDSLYLRPDVVCYESLLSKRLAAKLCSGEIDLDELVEYDDASLMRKLGETVGRSPIVYSREELPVFSFRVDISMDWLETPNPAFLEMGLLGIKRGEKAKLQTYPEDDRVVLSVYHMWDDPGETSTFRVILNALQGSDRMHPVVSTVFRLRDRLRGEESVRSLKLAEQILCYAFGRKAITHDDSRVRSTLSRMVDFDSDGDANAIIWEIYDVLEKRAAREGIDVPPVARRFLRMLRHPSRSKTRSLRDDDLRKTWDRMIMSLLGLAANPNLFGKCWEPILKQMSRLVRSGSDGSGEVYEALAYSAELVSARKSRPKMVLPSVRLTATNGNRKGQRENEENEIDVVSIELYQQHVAVKLVECTKSASGAKATDDHTKLRLFQNMLNSRRFSDLQASIEVVSSSMVGKDFLSVDQLLKGRS